MVVLLSLSSNTSSSIQFDLDWLVPSSRCTTPSEAPRHLSTTYSRTIYTPISPVLQSSAPLVAAIELRYSTRLHLSPSAWRFPSAPLLLAVPAEGNRGKKSLEREGRHRSVLTAHGVGGQIREKAADICACMQHQATTFLFPPL
jgi:hypothetical protein